MRTSLLASATLAFAVTLGAAGAHAQPDVVVDGNGNAIAINNLDVDGTTYDVEFMFEDGFAAYGPTFDDFDFSEPNEATVVKARDAVEEALNAESPVPDAAGPQGQDDFFIGFDVDETAGTILALGSEKIGPFWDTCRTRCLAPLGLGGGALFFPEEAVTWALFTESGAVTPPEISIMPSSQTLSAAALPGENAPDDQFFVSNSGDATLDYTITVDQTWLSVSPPSGSSTGEMVEHTVSYSTAGLPLGSYEAIITVNDSAAPNSPQTIDVTLIVTELPAISLSPTMLMPQAVLGSDALPDSFTVTNSGGLFLFYEVSVDVPWMSLDPVSGLAPGDIEVVYDTSGLPEGVAQGTITVSDPLGLAATGSQAIDVVLTIDGAADPIGTTEASQTSKVNQIPGLDIGVTGTYTKPGFPLLLPQTSISGNSLFHDGGSFIFSSPQTATMYEYGDWTFELRSTCAAGGDPCLVQTDNGTPWALRNVDLAARTARMVFTEAGALAFNDLAGAAAPLNVFATSQRFTGALGGLAGADALCTSAAAAAGLTGGWVAWLSDANTDAVDRIADAEYQLLDGTVVATSVADLTDGTLNAAIDQDENGATFAGNPWTGTQPDGTGTADTCGDWIDATNLSNGTQGQFPSTIATWTQLGSTAPCDFRRSLYCFGPATFQAEETFADVSFIPEPSATALAAAVLTALGFIGLSGRRRRR